MSNHDFEEDLNRTADGAVPRWSAGDDHDDQVSGVPEDGRDDWDGSPGDDRHGWVADGYDHGGFHEEDHRGGGNNGFGGGDHVLAPRQARNYQVARARQTSPDIYGRQGFAAGSAPRDDDVAFDFRKYLGILIKNRWLIAGITALSLSIGLVYTLLQAPTYRASATIQIKRAVANISGMAGVEESGREYEFYQTQYELLKSRALAERVVSSLNLADNPALFEPRPSGWERLHGLVFSRGHAEAPNISQRQGRALGAIRGGLTVEPVQYSSIVRINFDSRDPVLAPKVANAVAENFITSNLERNFEASAYARQFLEERLQELRLKLEESELALVQYAEEQDILNTGSDQTLSTTNLSGVNSALAAAGKERLRHEMQWQQVEAMDGLRLPKTLESATIERLRGRRTEFVLEYEDKLKKFKPGFPEMVRLQTRIEEVDRHIEQEVTRIRESLRLQYEASVQEQRALRQQLEDLKAEVMDYQNRNIKYTILRREVDTNRSLYEGLLQRYKEIGVSGGIDNTNAVSKVSFVDRAQQPGGPYKPRLSKNLAVAFAFGLMLGGAAAFGREIFDSSYRSPEDLEEGLGLPLLGIIPRSDGTSDFDEILNDHRSAVTEAYRSLRTALQFSTTEGTPRTLLVTSAMPSEGKSTASVNLAWQFAKLGLRVLLIDADMRKPSLHQLLDCDPSRGLSQFLVTGSTPPDAFQATALPNLTLLPSGPMPPNPAELLAGPRMASLLSVAAEEFDLVIVDSPPIAGLADAPLLASMSCGTLLVVEANKTHRRVITAGLKRLLFARAEVVGVIFNKFHAQQAGYGYGHGYGYGDDSYYGYGEQKRLADAKDE